MTTCKARDPDPPPVPRACAGDDLTPVPCAFQLGDLQTTWVTTSVSLSWKYNCVVLKGGVDHQPWTLPRLLLLCSRSCPTLGAIPKLHGNTSASGSRLPTLQSRSSLGRDRQSLRVQLCPQPRFCDTIQETSSVVHSAPRLVFAGRKFESVRWLHSKRSACSRVYRNAHFKTESRGRKFSLRFLWPQSTRFRIVIFNGFIHTSEFAFTVGVQCFHSSASR